MKNKVIALAVFLLLLGSAAYSFGKERRGAEVVVQKRDGTQVQGELIAVKDTVLLIGDNCIEISEAQKITIKKKSKLLLGAGLGLLIGSIGMLTGKEGNSHNSYFPDPSAKMSFDGMSLDLPPGFLIALCTSLGAAAGGYAGIDHGFNLAGFHSAKEYNDILTELRRKSRFPENK